MDVELGEWSPTKTMVPVDPEDYPALHGRNPLEFVNNFIHEQSKRCVVSPVLANSYRTYWLQILKDLNDWWVCNRKGKKLSTRNVIDTTLAKAQPWRFTAHFIDYLNRHFTGTIRVFATPEEMWDRFEGAVDDALENGSIYALPRYQKVSHVLLDLAYDAGWNTRYASIATLKQQEGLDINIERTSVLRSLTLYLAQHAYLRSYPLAAREVLLFGFPDSADVVSALEEHQLGELLDKPAKEAARTLINQQLAEMDLKERASQITRGALGLVRGDPFAS